MVATKKELIRELAKRELKKSAAPKIVLKGDFSAQDAFINDASQFLTAQCSRRAGKTTALGMRFLKTMEKYPGTASVYLGLTFDSAKKTIMPLMRELNDRFKIGLQFFDSGEIRHPNGAKLYVIGASMKGLPERFRGQKHPAIGVDEAQGFGEQLQYIINDILTPCMMDFGEDAWLAVTGTPGPVPQGYFFQATHEGQFGFSRHAWTVFENPHMPNPQKFFDKIMEKNKWTETTPTVLREWRNKWILDVESLWIRYNPEKNHYDTINQDKVKKFHCVLGVDLGYDDADALAILAYSDDSPEIYLLEEIIAPKQGIQEVVDQVKYLQAKYSPVKTVIDSGALGKKIAEEMRRRHQIVIHAADKARKQENVELLNDSLRLGEFKAKKDSRFAKDSYLIQIDWDKTTPDRIVIKKDPHSDVIDAVLYAYKECYGYMHVVKPYAPPKNSAEARHAEAEQMFEEELKYLQEEKERNREFWGE